MPRVSFDRFALVGGARRTGLHSLNAFLERGRGNILAMPSFPNFRRRRYATTILRLAIEFALEKLGIEHLLVTCDVDDIGSIKTIERNGGVLENIVTVQDFEEPVRRYWIEHRLTGL